MLILVISVSCNAAISTRHTINKNIPKFRICPGPMICGNNPLVDMCSSNSENNKNKN